MKSRVLVIAAGLGACSAAQSARPLAPGKTQVSVALTGNRIPDLGPVGDLWTGQVMVRRGLSSNVDLGVILTRVPGVTGGLSMIMFEPKVRLTPDASDTTISAGVGGGLLWSDRDFDADLGAYLLTPTVYFGQRLSPTAEAVLAPRLFVAILDDGDDGDDSETNLGGSLGVRFTNPARTWAFHPELGLVRFSGETTLSLGLSISAGD